MESVRRTGSLADYQDAAWPQSDDRASFARDDPEYNFVPRTAGGKRAFFPGECEAMRKALARIRDKIDSNKRLRA